MTTDLRTRYAPLLEVADDEVVTRGLVRDVTLPSGRVLALVTLDNGHDYTRPNTLGPATLVGLGEVFAQQRERAARGEIQGLAVTGKRFNFAAGADLGDPAVLAAVAAAQDLDPTAARRFLASASEVEAVHADNLRAHRLGINGVPCFVVAGRHAIAGAQEPEVLERLLDVALVAE